MRTKPTIRDVARQAGVSIQTVSTVLNRRPGVSPETRLRVLEAARLLGYRPNAVARSLRTRQARILGLLVADVANPYFAEVARGVEDAARVRGYSVILGSTDNDLERIRELLQIFQDHWVSGIIAATGHLAPDYTRLLAEVTTQIPVVQIGRHLSAPQIARVMVDDLRGGYVATAHLLALGRRRIAIITGPLDTPPGLLRLQGYQQALHDWGSDPDPALVVEGRFNLASGAAGADQLLARGLTFDGLVAGNDLMAIGAIERLRQAGLRIPEDVAVIGYDGTALARVCDPPLSTIAQPTYQLGQRAATLLCEQLVAARETVPEIAPVEVLECTLILRRSTLGRPVEIVAGPISAPEPWRPPSL